MTNRDPEGRKRRAFERLGTDQPRCPACGETDWRCFDAHHIAGRKRDELTVPVCSNCHRKLSDAQKDHTEAAADDQLLANVGHFLLGLADLFRLILDKLSDFGLALIERSTISSQEIR